MNVVFVGCGYVSSFYARTLSNHSQLNLLGVFDAVEQHAAEFCKAYRTKSYQSFEQVLSDESVDAIINLTNPDSHFEISRAALECGKHVYSEKPLAMRFEDASELVRIAKERGLQLCSAPCNLLSESAQTVWRALNEKKVGQVRVVYAEMDDGLIHQLPHKTWLNEIGRPWPHVDEFEVGCTLEHAAYYVSWLVAYFGSVTRLTTFPRVLIDPKCDEPVRHMAPDFSVACLEFESGVVARLTCSIVAEHNHRLTIYGDEGTLSCEDCWYYDSPVHFEPFSNISARLKKLPFVSWFHGAHRRKLPLVSGPGIPNGYRTGGHRMDFCRGIAEMADAIQAGVDSRLGADFSLHINEVVLKIQSPVGDQAVQEMVTRAPQIAPMPWAEFEMNSQLGQKAEKPNATMREQHELVPVTN